jgi:hypothetical protein
MGVESSRQMACRDTAATFMTLFLSIPRLQLMSNRKNQHDIFGGNPTIFRDVAEPAARQYQLTPPVFGLAAQQRMIRK